MHNRYSRTELVGGAPDGALGGKLGTTSLVGDTLGGILGTTSLAVAWIVVVANKKSTTIGPI
jgi:hypothetical protein